MTDSLFLQSMNDKEKEAWESFRDVVHNFLGNRKAKKLQGDCESHANGISSSRLQHEP